MLRIHILLLLVICVLSGFSQQRVRTERYSGSMGNKLMKPGEVTYYYYTDDRERIMHGIFRYRLRWQNDERQRVNQTISGSMKHGKKSGNWSYAITVQDYFEDREGYFYSYDIQLNAGYKEGIPHGNWSLNKTVKKRKKSGKERIKWKDYTGSNTYTLNLTFEKGKLTDSIYLFDKANEVIVRGNFDDNGFYHGDWIIQKQGVRKEEKYHHGIVIKRIRKNVQSGETESRESLLMHKDMWNSYTSESIDNSTLNFKPETLDILEDKSHIIPKMINEHLFDYRFFLYSEINGDELIRDYRGENPARLFSGVKKIQFRHRVNKEQARYLSNISREAQKTIRNYTSAVNYAQQHKVEEKAKTELSIMDRKAKLAGKYKCLSGIIKSYLDVDKGRNAAYECCNARHSIEIKLPTDLSGEELIKHIYRKVRKLHEESGELLDKVKQY
ncbi:MAG: hypothetical protein R6U19_03510 [Bacteroidales bacterium]